MSSLACRYLSRWMVVLHAYWFGTGQRYKYHLSFLELFGVLVKTQSGGRWPCLGDGSLQGGGGRGVASCLGFDEWLHGFLVFTASARAFSCYLLSPWSKKNNAMGPRTEQHRPVMCSHTASRVVQAGRGWALDRTCCLYTGSVGCCHPVGLMVWYVGPFEFQ